jgi:carboxymethylenebutenolidase
MPRRAIAVLVLLVSSLALAADAPTLPPGEKDAKARLDVSPRHSEYPVLGKAGTRDINGYIVFPERKDKAPVVIVIHEIYGLTDWIKGVCDQLAADGFIAIAPDFLSGRGPAAGGTDTFENRDAVVKAIRAVTPEEAAAIVNVARDYGRKLPAASGTYATVGFCWGGARSFEYAAVDKDLSAAVVYYGTSPAEPATFEKVTAPVLGLYGSDDARVNATIPTAVEQMKKLNKPFTPITYDGAGHGFLRGQDQRNGANLKAAQSAWPETVKFIRSHAEKK